MEMHCPHNGEGSDANRTRDEINGEAICPSGDIEWQTKNELIYLARKEVQEFCRDI